MIWTCSRDVFRPSFVDGSPPHASTRVDSLECCVSLARRGGACAGQAISLLALDTEHTQGLRTIRQSRNAAIMTTIEISLPEDLAERAKRAGLLSDGVIQQLLEDAMRRRAGRALLDIAKRVHDEAVPPMSDDEIVAEVKAARAERRARQNSAPGSPESGSGPDAGRP
jgi:hypothetical protein